MFFRFITQFVSINSNNVAVVTLQENNAVVLIDLESQTVVNSFSMGTVDLTQIDILADSMVTQTESLAAVPREPDGVTWIGTEHFAVANEGGEIALLIRRIFCYYYFRHLTFHFIASDMLGGTRGFTIFNVDGTVSWDSGTAAEHIITSAGHYDDGRSDAKGVELENVAYDSDHQLLFINSERSHVVLVYDVSDPSDAKFHQILPSGFRPEGGVYVPSRGLYIAACEEDVRDDKIRGSIVVYEYGSDSPAYPTLMSVDQESGVPIPWGAISGMSGPYGGSSTESTLYAVDDSAFMMSRIFHIDTSSQPAMITDAMYIKDTNGIFAAFPPYGEFDSADLAAMINEDGTVNIDGEGIVADVDGGFWVASEGSGTIGEEDRPIEKLNFLFKTDKDGVIERVVSLPDELNDIQLRFGFEGVSLEGDYAVVAFQRAWGEEENPRIGIYNTVESSWKFVFYPLDASESQYGGWVGLSDITSIGAGNFLVLERDNQGGPDAAIKRIYSISLGDLSSVTGDETVEKTLVHDLFDDMKAPGGLGYEKFEGMAYLNGEVWVSNDNDAVSDNTGETQVSVPLYSLIRIQAHTHTTSFHPS